MQIASCNLQEMRVGRQERRLCEDHRTDRQGSCHASTASSSQAYNPGNSDNKGHPSKGQTGEPVDTVRIYRCDICKKDVFDEPLQITLTGYYPRDAGGILIPENCRKFEFCSHDCFVAYMKWALKNEKEKS